MTSGIYVFRNTYVNTYFTLGRKIHQMSDNILPLITQSSSFHHRLSTLFDLIYP